MTLCAYPLSLLAGSSGQRISAGEPPLSSPESGGSTFGELAMDTEGNAY